MSARKFTPRELVKRAHRRYDVARGVLAQRRKNAHASGVVTRAEAEGIHEAEADVREGLRLLRHRQAQARAAARERRPRRVKALEEARRDLDVRETAGNNWGGEVTKMIRAVGWSFPVAWCGVAVAMWYIRAGSDRAGKAWSYVPTLEKLLTRVRSPKPGHVVIYNWNGGVPDHTGLFERWVVKGETFIAIEGNTRPGTAASDAGGGEGVHRRTRSVSEVSSFRRVLG